MTGLTRSATDPFGQAHHPQRFHALDATRAFALLLGVFFHAVWFYIAIPYLAPVGDVRSNVMADWIFTTAHSFRLQLFFVLAGFFAHLLFHQRGYRAFASNRLTRIAVPLLLGWQTIVPVYELLYTWGAQVSGQREFPLSAWGMLVSWYASGKFLIPASIGGSFGFAHLWFLYYLLLYYAAILPGRWLILKLAGARYPLHTWVDGGTNFVASSFWGPVMLWLVFTPLIWVMHGWIGVDLPGESLYPARKVLLIYGMFFLFGWLLHRLAGRLPHFFVHWRWHLSLGIAASIGLYAAYYHLRVNHLYGLKYPALALHDVRDWSEFRSAIAGKALAMPVDPVMSRLWARLSPTTRARFNQVAELTVDERQGVILALNQVLMTPSALSEDPPSQVVANPPFINRQELASMLLNREILQPYLRGVGAIISPQSPWYQPLKLGYSVCYSLVMCSLIFGCLGVFQATCNQFNPPWRYLTDASYWIYLVHLPVLLAIEIPIHRWDVTALVKIPLLLGTSMLLCTASYHYMVRSTFIGKLLNGRAYSFHLNPWKALQRIPDRDTDPRADCINNGPASKSATKGGTH
jgi:peptidoglycan/LPS O-acetylase OafA/YrhL